MVFCLKLNISGIIGPNKLHFTEMIFKCLGKVLGYFPELPPPSYRGLGEATSLS